MNLIAAFLLATSPFQSQPSLAHKGDCGWIHGRYVEANGSRIHRIFMLGTRHALSIDIPDEGDDSVPAALSHYYEDGRFQPRRDQMFGDFYVCAVERRVPGSMQRVRLKRVRSVRITTY
jgi:hypothetical protein